MKQFHFIAIVSAFFFLTSCGSEESKSDVKAETPPTITAVKKGELRIAYYNQDSLKNQFEVYKSEEARINKKTKQFQDQLIAKENQLRNMAATLQDPAKAAALTADQLSRLEQDFNRKQQSFAAYQQQQAAKLDEETSKSLIALNKKIEAASKKYCEKYKIDILLIQAEGGQIGFITPTFEVTESFIQFLNKEEADLEKSLGGK